jgi:arabinofuranosyltransferase
MAVTQPQPGPTDPASEVDLTPPQYRLAPSRLVKIAQWLAIALFLFLAHRVFIYTPDDAYITYRYSLNVAEGYGPVFNRNAPAFDRTEGYSCPLFMFLMAVLWKLPLGLDMIFRAKLLGIACGVALLFLAPKLAARLGLPAWAQAAFPLLLSAHAVFSVSSVDGMETMLAMLWTTWAALRFITEWQDNDAGNSPFPLSGLLFAACGLTRPEGLLMGLFALGTLLLGRRGKIGRYGVQWMLAFFLPVAAWWGFRLAYYGSFMPNTYYAKNINLEAGLLKGLSYLLRTFFRFVDESPVYAVIGGLWWLMVAIGAYREAFRRAPGIIVSLCVAVQILFAVRTGGDWMSSWRYMAPVLVLSMLLSLAAIAELADATRSPRLALAMAGIPCAVLFGVGLWGHKDYWNRPYIGYLSWADKGFTGKDRVLLKGWLLEKSMNLSDWLNAHLPAGAEIAYSEMGVTPYLSPQLRFLDIRGLTDRGIARLPGTKHEQVGVTDDHVSSSTPVGVYLRDVRKPDYIIWGIRLVEESEAKRPSDFRVAEAIDRLKGEAVLSGTYECVGAFENPPAPPPNCRDVIGVYKRR